VPRVADINLGETITMAPMVVNGKVMVGNSGGENGVRGRVTALNASDGSIAWRAYSTGPDRDVLIGERFKPFYEQDRGQDLGVASWPPDAWRIGGGTVWGWLTYDPEANLLYYGTANPGPWNPCDGWSRGRSAPRGWSCSCRKSDAYHPQRRHQLGWSE
jgi:glucose dehydrogenase